MGEKLIRENVLLGMVKAKLKGRTLREVAEEMGVSITTLHSVVEGTRPMGKKIPAYFNLQAVTLYEWKRPPSSPRK